MVFFYFVEDVLMCRSVGLGMGFMVVLWIVDLYGVILNFESCVDVGIIVLFVFLIFWNEVVNYGEDEIIFFY